MNIARLLIMWAVVAGDEGQSARQKTHLLGAGAARNWGALYCLLLIWWATTNLHRFPFSPGLASPEGRRRRAKHGL